MPRSGKPNEIDQNKPLSEGDGARERVFSESVNVPAKQKAKFRLRNPNPSLSVATWLGVFALLAAASGIMIPVFGRWQLSDAVTSVNGVRLPAEIRGKKLIRGSFIVGLPRFVGIEKPPETGSVEGVVYGDPAQGGLVLFSLPGESEKNLSDFLKRILGEVGEDEPYISYPADVELAKRAALTASGKTSKIRFVREMAKSDAPAKGGDAESALAVFGVCIKTGGRIWAIRAIAPGTESAALRRETEAAFSELLEWIDSNISE
ncbi:MAG: hypothetical protein HRF49_10360 [bacterium]